MNKKQKNPKKFLFLKIRFRYSSLLGTIATVLGRIAMLPHVTHFNATVSTLIPIIAEGMEQPGTTWEHYFLY
jgi:hypothetical protein